ncbi:MAG: pyridoxamine 5'-phosphate oxidase family protein [Thermoflexales bacterium]|nr:pyridoxamine 5'-phosphate oxidase family protein [Thermoflexales bacterium]
MKTPLLTDDVLHALDKSVLCWLATVDGQGNPNVSPKEVFAAIGRERIVIAHIASPRSLRNIAGHPRACVSFIDIFAQKGYKVSGAAEIVKRTDARFTEYEAPLLAITRGLFPILAIFAIEVEAVEAILAPSYRMIPGTTEATQIAAAMDTYGVTPRTP